MTAEVIIVVIIAGLCASSAFLLGKRVGYVRGYRRGWTQGHKDAYTEREVDD